ncbi:MAG: cellulase family glycosylhydrolase [Terricaulis sp.]
MRTIRSFLALAALALTLASCGHRIEVPEFVGEAGEVLARMVETPSGRVALPLKTDGPRIVDQSGTRVRLVSVNWFGAESGSFVVGGLDKQAIAQIARTIRAGGFNSVRLPWSNEMVETNPVIEARYLSANPDLVGKTALEVFDAVIDGLGREGLLVILDNHRSRGDWCCDEEHGDGLWHTPAFPESAWLADWREMAERYQNRPNVIAAELRNEIRPDPSQGLTPTWGGADPRTDWRAAAMRGGEVVLSVAPHWLIIVGGLRYQEDLIDVRSAPILLSVQNRVVYAAHDYAWWRTPAELADPAAFAAGSQRRWGYILSPGQNYTAPVYVSEWGGCVQPSAQGQPCPADRAAYFYAFAQYAQASGIDYAYWPLNGTQSAGYNRTEGAPESYGLLDATWSRYANAEAMDALMGEAEVEAPH